LVASGQISFGDSIEVDLDHNSEVSFVKRSKQTMTDTSFLTEHWAEEFGAALYDAQVSHQTMAAA